MKKKKTEKAVALVYDKKSADAPQVLASGRGKIAEKIIETAREAGIHITEDPDLLELLASVPVGHEIPEDLYRAVAEILAFVYRINGQYQAPT